MNRVRIDPQLQHEYTPPWRAADHEEAFRVSCALTYSFRRRHQPQAVAVDFENAVAALQRAKVQFVLAGLHGIVGWRSEPRATGDLDVLVTKKDHVRAVGILKRKYPDLEVVNARDSVRL